jgi:hypothetical protein
MEKLKHLLQRTVTYLCSFCERYLYLIPVVMGAVALSMMVYLFYSTVMAVNDMNNTIKSIPAIVEKEMTKTRVTLQQEASSSREVIVDQHQATREELHARMDAAEKERRATKAALDKIEQKVQEKPVVPPKRKKVLGVF